MTLPELKKALAKAERKRKKLHKARERVNAVIRWAHNRKLKKLAKRLVRTRDGLNASIKDTAKRIEDLKKQIKDHQGSGSGPTVMFDAVTVSNIPAEAKAVGCYIGPSTVTCPEVFQKFPDARKVRITQAAYSANALDADCVDVEPQDATNSGGADWAKRKLARGDKRPIIYTSASNAAALISACAGVGVSRSEFRLWSAHYTQHEHVCSPTVCGYPEADGTQWTSTALGRSLDQSKLKDNFF